MKIDRNKLKKSSTDVPVDCRPLIERLKVTTESSLLEEIQSVKTWTYGKCELYHWADVLDIFDDVLEKACKKESDSSWTLACDVPANNDLKQLLLKVLRFTSLLIEHSFSRHLYNSMEHLTSLMSSCDMTVVMEVLDLLYVFSKRSNFLTRLSSDKKQRLISRLVHLAESWGGKDNGFGLADCCTNRPVSKFPGSATTLHFEFYIENADEKSTKKGISNAITCIHIDNLDQISKLPTEIMEDLLVQFKIPEEKQTLLYTHIRLAKLFSKYESRLQCVQARLQAVAILVYSNAMQENMNALLYPGFIEELVDLIELKEAHLVEIKAASLRTLTSIIHLERNPKLTNIIDATGAASYHGFLPVLVRTCIQHMIDAELEPFPQQYATALFSFLYHLASYENGVEALVSCGMMESLLKVINWFGEGQDHITFVTRAVRVVDLITNLDMAAFQSHGGLAAFINRLQHEVGVCRKENPFEIRPRRMDSSMDSQPESPPMAMETDANQEKEAHLVNGAYEGHTESKPFTNNGTDHVSSLPVPDYSVAKTGLQCFPQRAALLKSMLNFLKKAIPDPAFSESIRHLMDGSLPKSLKHIISNAEYYGPSLFLLATDVVTVYVFQEPSLLSSLQDKGLTDVVLHALLVKDVPATREVLASLPNVFSALCLNARGLEAFVHCRPFDRLFKVLLSPDYLPAMRKRRSSDPFGDTASNLGNAMDELMRHQPSLRTDATKAIIQLLEEVCLMGQDPKYVCQKPQPKNEQNMLLSLPSPQPQDAGSSDEEEEEEEIPAEPSQEKAEQSLNTDGSQGATSQPAADKQAIPLMDYVLNVMKFIEAILSNNSTDDHCREFVNQKGLIPLMSILGLPNLPIDFPASPACQAVASVCKAILTLSREPQVLKQGLLQLNEVLEKLNPLHEPLESPGGSVLLRELATATVTNPDSTLSPQATPLLHALSAAHAYIMMFVHVCRIGQTDIRTISVNHWGSELGLQVLSGLSKLYTSLVWESTILLALCSDDILPPGCDFGQADMEKLLPKDIKLEKETKDEDGVGSTLIKGTGEMESNGVSHAMESLTTSETNETPMEVTSESQQSGGDNKDSKKSKMSPTLQAQVKQIKPLLSVSSRLGRALAELFGLLVKLSVGTRVRQRASQMLPPTPVTPTPAAQAVAKALTKLLADGLSWTPPDYSPVPKLRLTFLVCSVGFTSPMLFSDVKQPYHLMLQKFVSSGGQEALFKAFEWALSMEGMVPLDEGLEHPDLPGGTGEFLDAWLMLMEKMVNPKTVLETPHTLPAKSSQANFMPFDPVAYLIKTQKAAFNAVMHLWNKKPLKIYGSRMSESILAILCHIIKAESIIKASVEKEKDQERTDVATSSGASIAVVGGRNEDLNVNAAHLQQLMDMGFSRERCLESLLRTNSVVQATDYLLTHASAHAPGLGLDLDMTEEDQMMRAIAMSLGDNAVMSTDQADNSKSVDKKDEAEEMEKSEDPLDKACLDNFTEKIFPGCLTLLDTLQETVYRVCDLITVVTQRNGIEWQKRVLSDLVAEVQLLAQTILSLAPSNDTEASTAQTQADKIANMPESARFATRIHLFSLLFEEAMMPCAEALESTKMNDLLVQVLVAGKNYLTAVKQSSTPKWLAPLLILLDLYEKVSVISKRKAEAEKMLANCHTWKWFDDSSGRWCKYSVANNKTIDDAYQMGDTNVRFQAGRRRYTVHFNSMVQVNEETGNRRPIMLTLPGADEKQQNKDDQKEENNSFDSQPPENKMETDAYPIFIIRKPRDIEIVKGLNSDQVTDIIRSVVSLISIPVESETLHAALRLVLRLTREHKYALLFAELGGPKLLLGLTQASAFQGFLSLATLLFRHVLEDPDSLRSCMEEVVKSACSGSGSSMSGVSQGSLGAKEVHYVFRVLGPAACRNAPVFTDVAKESLRIALPPPPKRDEDEARLTGPNAPQILKCIATQSMTVHTLDYPLRGVVEDLLNALVIKYNWKEEGSGSGSELRAQTLAEAIAEVVSGLSERHQEMMRQNSTAELPPTDEENVNHALSTTEPGSSKDDKHKDKDSKSAEESRKQRPLLPKSALLRLLSEIIKSYSSCTQLITQYVYPPGLSELVLEECSVLAFVLDQLLPQCQNAGDKDCPALSRVFIASIASCNHSPDAQLTLVCEVKAALQRALALPESSDKHARIQALTSLVSTMIEACPTPGQIPNQVFKGQQNLLGRPSPMNNIVKNLIKKGLVADLARIAHSLDLSSPYMANTINAALKPLETLSRNVNQPLQFIAGKPKPKSEEPEAGLIEENNTTTPNNEQAIGTGVETSVATNAGGGDLQIEDITEHSDQHEDLEETEPLEAVEPARVSQEAELEDVLDELLHRDRGASQEDEVIGEIIMDTEPSQVTDESQDVIIDVEVEEESMDHHDSQMISQVSEGDEEETEEEDDDNQTTHSVHGDEDDTAESGSEADEDDNDDGENDEDDQDEEDEDEDGDEGSDMEADEDDYIDIDETSMGQNYNDTFVIHADNMFPPGSTQHIIFNALDNGQVRTYQMPISFNDNDNGNDAAVPSMPPAPSNVPASHPLLLRQSDTHSVMGISRVQRGRQRGTCRYNPTTQTLHVNFPRQPNPPVILQRLLGPTTAADVLQLTNSLTTQAGPNHTRVVLSNNDLRIINRPEEDLLEELFQDTYPEGSGSTASGVLSSIPTTLTRWTEEAKVLDGDSVHNCIAALKTEILEVLENHRDDELAERREKRKKTAEEEAAKKKEDDDKTRSSGANTSVPQNMEVSQNSTVAAADVHHGVTTDPQVLSSIPLPTTTVSSTHSQDPLAYPARQITSEAASAAEAIASQIVETVISDPLSSSYYSSTPNYSSEGMYRSIPHPMSSMMSGLFEPDIVTPPFQFQHFPDLATPLTLPIVPPPTRHVPRSDFLSRFRVPLSAPAAHPLVSMTSAPQPLNPTGTPAVSSASALLGDLSFANITVPHTSLVTPGLAMSVSASNSITPNAQGLPIRTPSAPMPDRHRMPYIREGQPPMASEDVFSSHLVPPATNVSSLASLLLNEDDMDQFTAFGTMGVQQTPATTGAQTTPTSGSELSSTLAHQSSNEGTGALTPEDVSNITSSDAATVHSSGSDDSPQEFSMGSSSVADRNLANLASIAAGISVPTATSDGRTTASTSTSDSSSESNTASSSSTSTTAQSSSSSEVVSSAPSSTPLLAGVDPSFLAALPDGIRQEVIAEQLRLQRLQQQHAQRQQSDGNAASVLEVSQEFLAALPASIQEEVLAQQRLEQERLNAQNQAQSNPETPVDPTTFFASLPPSLRQSVLADMDDSMMAVLPPDLATEAQSLRREYEDRHRRLMQERLFTQGSSGSLSAILRHAGTLRYTLRGAPRGGGQWSFGSGRLGAQGPSAVSSVRVKGRHLLDHEGLTCLLILLFVDEPKINTGRLHRVLRNLCYHGPTRAWVVKSMLSILQRTGESKDIDEKDRSKSPDKGKGKRSAQPMQTDSSATTKSDMKNQGSWLSISLEAALGCRANVFQVQRPSGRKHTASTNNAVITIHPQASPVVCRHVLDALISLAKMFPYQFLPASASKAKEIQKCDSEKEKQQTPGTSGSLKVSAKSDKLDVKMDIKDTDFWELLLKLDSASSSKKGKSLQKFHSSTSSENESLSKDYDSAPIGHLMLMLSHPVIKRSQLLTDRLLRLLGLISTGLSDSQRFLQPTTTTVGRILRTVYTYATAPSTQRATTTTTSTNSSPASSLLPATLAPARRPSVGTVANLRAMSTAVASSESTQENKEKSKEEKKNEDKKEEKDEAAVLEKQLHLAVQVLTSKSCSEEGLEDATNLLLQLSRANNSTRIAVLKLLLDGGWELGMTVCYHIRSLLLELKGIKCKETENDDSEEGKEMDISPSQPSGKGVMEDRFTPGTKIIVSAPKKIKGGRELQLPSMNLFTSKASSQHFFLRILKVIIQLREAARSAGKKSNKRKVSQELGHIAEAMSLQEAEAETILQIVHRRENRAHAGGARTMSREAALQASGQALEITQGQESSRNERAPPSAGQRRESPMETDKPGPSTDMKEEKVNDVISLPRLSEQLQLEDLWHALGECLTELAKTPDQHAVLILQPAVEAFFIVHAGEKDSKHQQEPPQTRKEDQLSHLNSMDIGPASPAGASASTSSTTDSHPPVLSRENSLQMVANTAHLPPDTQKFLKFAETHRTVLNQILRQSTTPLADGPFSVLVDHTRILDFDVKRRYFRQELDRLDEGTRREDLAVHVRREHVFEDSFRELFRRTADEWKHRFYIVFEGEEGQDAGGLLREWYIIISREIFNPMYALFRTSPGDRVTYTINPSSHCNSNHLSYFKFVGRIIAKAIYDNKLLECYFTRSFYKHIIGQSVKYTDMESEDYSFYQGLVFLMEHHVEELGYDLTFSTEIQEFGVTEVRDLKPNGRNFPVTEENKKEYVKLVCQMKMTGAIRKQLNAFLEGFYDIIPKRLTSIFNEQELELLISGLPTIDIDDLKANTEYHKYQPNSLQVQWFWRALRSFDQADRARFLQFVTGTSKVPLQGFSHLEGMNGVQKFQIHRDDRSTDRLPAAHTCFNQLDLPAYETYDKLRHMLLLAVNECSEGFGLA
ncbi:hypothetical protein CHS0354_039470 [Potamilus streckersoni]|uniref:HECT-type E3 ubiquitin transferase n=1 Tax=Potamilus streckersoni TaxID=2493646 RepID=A0AAE0SYB1_9BIVA|nr:hypothetical protein CHS0354_039470 [Potamilus streckersoni]